MTADTPPTISTPANNSSVQTLRPTVTGKAAPNARVGVHNEAVNVYYGDCYANANGDWTYTFTQDLAPGKVTLKFGQFSLTERLSADTAHTLTLSATTGMTTTTPPTISTPANNSSVQTLRPTLTGKAAPNARVGVHNEAVNVYYGDCYANANGDWTFTFTQDLAPGKVTLKFGQFSLTERLSPDTAHTLTLSATTGMTTTTPPTISTPANNSSVQTLRPTFTGKAAPNARVGVHNEAVNVYYGDCYANANGDWTYTFTQDLAPGKVTLKFGQFSVTERLSADTAHTLTLSATTGMTTTTPPTISTPANNSSVQTLRPTLTGKAAPNARVGVHNEAVNVYYGDCYANANGDWTFTFTQDLAPGKVTLKFGQFSLTERLSPDTAHTLTLSATTGMTTTTPPTISTPANNSSVQTLRPTFTGKAAPNARVGVHNEAVNVYYGDCYANANGDWTFTFTQDLAPGKVTLKFGQFSLTERLSADTAHTLTLSATTGMTTTTPPTISTPANNSSVQTLRPTFTGRAAPNARVGVHNEAVNVYYGDCYANANGDWTFTFTQDLAPGKVTLKFGQFSLTERLSPDTAHTLTLSATTGMTTTTPPTISTPANNSSVQTLRPTFTGKAAPNARVGVHNEAVNVYYGDCYANANGDWTYTFTQELAPGKVTLKFGQFSLTERLSPDTAHTLTLSATTGMTTTTPPTISTPANNSSVQTLRPTFTGKAAPNARVGVHNEAVNVYYGDCYANANGDWTYTFTQELAPGKVTLKFGQFSLTERLSPDTAITLTLR